jgi:hypothetical protein
MRKGVWHGLLTGLALLLAACGGGGQPQPDLTLAGISPQNPTVVQGETVTLTLTFASQNGFQGPVSLSVLEGGQPVSWLSPNAVQRNLNVPRGQQVQETLQVQVATNAPTGSRNLTVRAAYGNQVTERALTLTVNAPPSFTLSDPTPNPLSVQAGGTATFQVTLTSQNGFQGEVTLSLADGQDPVPQGLAITATNPSPITLQAGGSATVTATVSADAQVAPGTYRLLVRAQGGSVVQEKPLSVQVGQPASFSISLRTPYNNAVWTSRNPLDQQTAISEVGLTVTPQNGFTGSISLSLVDDQGNPVPGLSLDPSTVTVTGNNPQGFAVRVRANNNIPLTGAGKGYAVRFRASSGSVVREAPLTVDVWTKVGLADVNFSRVAYGNGIFVVAGQNGYDGHDRIYVYNPQDGSFTQVYDAPIDADCGWVRDVTYDPLHNAWVAAGYPAVVLRSTDNAQSWQIVYGARSPNYSSCSEQYPNEMQMEKVRFLNDRLMGWRGEGDLGTDKVYYSFDGGLTWNSTAIPTIPGYTEAIPQGITYGQGKFVAVGNLRNPNGPNGRFVAISTDGINWSTYPLNVPDTPQGKPLPTEVLYVPDWDRFVLAGGAGLVGISDDGLNWTFQFLADIGHLTGLAYGNGVVAAGSWSFNKVAVSADGQNWRVVNVSVAGTMSVAFGDGIFAVVSGSAVGVSP